MKLLFFIICTFITILSFSQNSKLKKTFPNKAETLKKVYINPDEEAISRINLSTLLANNLQYPDSAKLYGQQGAVRIKFIVERNGTITNIKKDEDSPNKNKPLIDEVIRVIKLTNGKWNPAKDNGKVVRSWHTQMFNICLFEDE
jgi:periplasmic protein TonB